MGVGGIGGREGEADAAVHVDLHAVHREGPVELVADAAGERLESGVGDVVVDEDGELVAAEPGDERRVRRGVGEASGDLDEYEVAGVVPEGVVDLLEPVEVHQRHRERPSGAVDDVQFVPQAVGELHPVGECGECVVEGFVFAESCFVVEAVDEAAVLECHAGVIGEGGEHGAVALLEAVHLAEAVDDGDEADDLSRFGDRRHDPVAGPEMGEHLPRDGRWSPRR
ncbi:MAG: hypothetical protein R2743_09005 [Ilumatobacteraceae bacterium]